jgi:hypothetical protein
MDVVEPGEPTMTYPEPSNADDAGLDQEGQLSAEDMLLDRGIDDALDEGYSPPENYRGATAFGVTPAEEARGESLDERLRQEVPDGPDPADAPLTPTDVDEDGVWAESDEFADEEEVGGERSGRLVDLNGGIGPDDEADLIGRDVGFDGGAASAEEAAMHIVE